MNNNKNNSLKIILTKNLKNKWKNINIINKNNTTNNNNNNNMNIFLSKTNNQK